MNGCRAKYWSLVAGALILVGAARGRALAEPTAHPSGSPVTANAISEAEKPAIRPTFASIPPAPTDIRPFTRWTAAIAEIKTVGAETAAEARAGPWILGGTEGWAAHARAEAAPPSPMTTPGGHDTDAFVREMIRRATPPPRAH
jgi:hypothetical protein